MNELTSIITDDLNAEENEVIQLVGMKLGEEEYAIDVLKIQEIIRTVEITIVPRSEGYVLGVMNLRGKVIPVIDLRIRFSLDKMDFDKSTRIIVVRFEKEHIGFVVDEVTEVIRISKTMVEPTPPLVGTIGQEYILGICKFKERLIILLDIDRVIAKTGGTLPESDLRKKFLGSKEKIVLQPNSPVEEPEKIVPSAAKTAPDVTAPTTPYIYSMADQVDSPEITQNDVHDDMDESINAILQDAVNQSKSTHKNSVGNEIHQSELDDLIAIELAKREAETEELNKKRKSPDITITPIEEHSLEEDALSIDQLIEIELAKREAETEELNKKRNTQGDKKKIDVTQESKSVDVSTPAPTPSEAQREESLSALKEVANKIINGENEEFDLEIKGEFGELLRLLLDIKNRVDEISPTVLNSQLTLPTVSSALTDIDTVTEKAAFNLLDSAQKLNEFYKNLQSHINKLGHAVSAKDLNTFHDEKYAISKQIIEAGDLGLHILEALEFQDITEQKLRKVVKSIEDVGARLGVIVGFIKSKDKTDNKEYDKVLIDLGFA